jgi:hypothetical protein
MLILYYIASLVSFVCWIMVVVKMFQNAGVLQGILGIICGLWAFIWGWMNVGTVQRNVMLAWSVALVVSMITGYSAGLFEANVTTTP